MVGGPLWILDGVVLFDFGDFILVIHENHDRVKTLELFRFQVGLGKNDYLVSRLKMPCRRTIEAYLPRFAGHHIGLPEYAVRDVRDIHVLEGTDAARVQQLLTDGYGTHVIQIRLSYRCPVDLRHANSYKHSLILRKVDQKANLRV